MCLQVKGSELNIQRLLKAVTALDIASARAKHADWCDGVRPAFLTTQQAAEVRFRIRADMNSDLPVLTVTYAEW